MKTTKKGFTLIELIVVIAIIGVLAAILVPSMLGYVTKSKIQGANSTAATLAKAANSAVTDLDEEDIAIGDGDLDGSKVTTADISEHADDIANSINTFFNDFKKLGTKAKVRFSGGVCVAAAVQSGNYVGTYPAVYTAKNWKDHKSDDISAGLDNAEKKANGTDPFASGSTGG